MYCTIDKVIFKALWDYDYVMTKIAPMLEDELKIKHVREISKRVTIFIKAQHFKYAAELIWCWSKREVTLEMCNDIIADLAKGIKEGE